MAHHWEPSRNLAKQTYLQVDSRPHETAWYRYCLYPPRTTLEPVGDQWKKMRKVMAFNVINPARLSWLLHKRTQEADNLAKLIYNQCINHENLHGGVINLILALRQYTGNMIRRMMFNRRHFRKGRKDGGPGYEEEQHVESLFTVLMHLNSFILLDYVPWLKPLDLEGYEKIVSEALRIVNGYHDPLVNERIKEWRQGKINEPQDLFDSFILAKDFNGQPALSAEEIKAQITIRLVEETDIPKLNYICPREAFQLHPIAPFNVLHVSNADTTVAGYFIPKGSRVLISCRGLDPKVWEEPLEFKPERHLKDEWGSGGVELTENELRGLGSAVTIMLFARLIQGFTWEVPPNVTKIDLFESEDEAKPLHALVKPRLSPALYTRF
ncbi:hypothetical protein GOBAR_AA25341 [Gossypium barbadense]|uniref:Cytochrome P450 n=1 Tax=Gossypium barbadense TaxID=3634 RepID=A0A2P5WWC0_GOSBA|nr:hypothetical protein GOBAR_AA25341 [Gossypium barbadense]